MGKLKNIWNRYKDRADKEERPFLRYAFVVTLGFLVFFSVIKRDNLFRWIEAGFTVRSQEKRIEFYKADIQRLQDEVKNLTTDKDSLEKYAREKFLFAEPGEDVYIEE